MRYSHSTLSLCCGGALIILGGFVMMAWTTNNIPLIQIRPTLVPMTINAALGFILSGLGLIFLNGFHLRAARIMGILTLTISGWSLMEFLLSWNVVGSLVFSTETSQFPSITLNTVVCLTLAGTTLMAVSHPRWHTKGPLLSGILGVSILSLGALGFFTNLIGLGPSEAWGQIIGMAIHTPGGFGFLAIGLMAFSWKNDHQKIIGSPQWLPILIGVSVGTITLGLWIHVDVQRQPFLGTAILLFGFLIALALTLGTYFLQRERALLENLNRSTSGLELEIRERTQIEKQLQISQQELRNLGHRLQSVREEEKSKIAREVHDELGQTLTVLKMDLMALEHEGPADPQAFHHRIQLMAHRLDLTVETVQRICMELRPKILEVFGLLDAIDSQTKEFQQRTGIHCQLDIDQQKIDLTSNQSLTCFRVLQEALTNVARHANATQVAVRVRQDDKFFHLKIQDNGRGIEEKEILNSTSLGLIGIRERVHQLQGTVNITGTPNKGTQVSITIPLVPPKDPG